VELFIYFGISDLKCHLKRCTGAVVLFFTHAAMAFYASFFIHEFGHGIFCS
jgi:hypothetical protein